MRISVVIVNFNYARFLAAAVQSVLDQQMPAYEIVVADDGSTDESEAVARRYSGAVRWISQSNAGHVAALQTGFRSIAGDAVLFLDADDVLYADCLLEVSRHWRVGATSKVQYRLDTIDEHGDDQKMPFPYFPPTLTPVQIRRRAFRTGIYPWTVSSGNVYQTAFVQKVTPIDTARFPRAPDGYLNKLAPLYGDVVSIPKILGAYRVHGANVWAQGRGALNGSRVSSTVALDLALDEEFRRRGAELGRALAPRADLLTPQHLEYRMLSLKLDPSGHPVPGEGVFELLRKALRSVRTDEALSRRGRVAWTIWFAAFAAMPRRLAERVFLVARSQTRRSPVAKALIGLTRT